MKPSLVIGTFFGLSYVITWLGLVLRSVVPVVKRASQAVRDTFWTIAFARVAVTVVTRDAHDVLVPAQVLCRARAACST